MENKKEKNAEEILKKLEEIKKTKKQIKKENKQLRDVLIGIGIFIALIVFGVLFLGSVRHFEYKGIKFDVVKEGDLILYNTKIPLYDSSGEYYNDYNFYLRNDPRKLNVDFDGELMFKKDIIINAEENFNCEGYGIISIANLKQLYEVLGAKMIKNENMTCDSEEKYMYINLKSGNKTKIEQTGLACYDISINNCEILQGTERFMIETFIQMNKELNKN